VGKIRHLEVKVLWIQDLVKQGVLLVRAIAGVKNHADIGTKALAKDVPEQHMKIIGMVTMSSFKEKEVKVRSHGDFSPSTARSTALGAVLAMTQLTTASAASSVAIWIKPGTILKQAGQGMMTIAAWDPKAASVLMIVLIVLVFAAGVLVGILAARVSTAGRLIRIRQAESPQKQKQPTTEPPLAKKAVVQKRLSAKSRSVRVQSQTSYTVTNQTRFKPLAAHENGCWSN
jgi:hypothetical protein